MALGVVGRPQRRVGINWLVYRIHHTKCRPRARARADRARVYLCRHRYRVSRTGQPARVGRYPMHRRRHRANRTYRLIMARSKAALLVLAAGFIVLIFNGGSRFTMGLMLRPMAEDLTWGRATLSFGVTLFMVISALALPLSGRLVDRFDTWKVVGGALILSGAGIAMMSLIETPWHAFFLYGIVFALGSAGTSITPIGVVISRVFPHRIGLANSVAISGMGIGQLIVIFGLAHQIEIIGWRGSFLLLGGLGAALLIPLAALAMIPATRREVEVPGQSASGSGHADVSSVRRSGYFWLILGLYAICGFQDFFVATHVVAFAQDEGMDALRAGNLYAFMGLMGLAGVLTTGYVSDRFGPLPPTVACFVLRIGLFGAIVTSDGIFVIACFALLYGATFWITAPLTVVFIRERFGYANLGAISGVVTMVHHAAGGFGAFAGGYVFDRVGNYLPMFQLMLLLSLVALLITRHLDAHRELQGG
ncbi:MAG: MFS transporter [Proteobacteria bacterium]|nr:MAG: MFS transporter [Pseudomonadota bacterium]